MRMTSIKGACLGAISFTAFIGVQVSSAAELVDLEGAWSGNGRVLYPSGARENARCRANFKRHSSTSFDMNSRCATASGKVEQTAIVRQISERKFTGGFKNDDYGVAGTISITVNGTTLQATVLGDNGAGAEFELSK
jgi:hypothetical protein